MCSGHVWHLFIAGRACLDGLHIALESRFGEYGNQIRPPVLMSRFHDQQLEIGAQPPPHNPIVPPSREAWLLHGMAVRHRICSSHY